MGCFVTTLKASILFITCLLIALFFMISVSYAGYSSNNFAQNTPVEAPVNDGISDEDVVQETEDGAGLPSATEEVEEVEAAD